MFRVNRFAACMVLDEFPGFEKGKDLQAPMDFAGLLLCAGWLSLNIPTEWLQRGTRQQRSL